MSWPGVTYGTRFRGESVSLDGYWYRFDVERANVADDVEAVRVIAAGQSAEVERAGETAAGGLGALAPSQYSLTLAAPTAGAFSALAGAKKGEWRLRVLRAIDGSYLDGDGFEDEVWVGYLMTTGLRDQPFEVLDVVSLQFSEGLDMLEARAAVTDDTEEEVAVVNWLIRALYPLGAATEGVLWTSTLPSTSWKGLTTASEWRPFLPDADGSGHVPADADPLLHIYARREAFVDEDGTSWSQLAVVRALLARFSLRLFQSGARLWALQRELLARTASAVPQTAYPRAAASYGARTSPDHRADRTLDGTRRYLRSPARAWGVPVREARSTYDFAEPFDLVVNGSFEEQGNADATETGTTADARYWTLTGGTNPTERVDMATGDYATDHGFEVADGNRWALRTPADGPGESNREAEQRDAVYLDPRPDNFFRLSYNASVHHGAITPETDVDETGRVALSFQTAAAQFGLRKTALVAAATIFPGKDVRMNVRPVDYDMAAVDGTAVLPAGATLVFYRPAAGTGDEGYFARLTLTAPLSVGDRQARGDLEVFGEGSGWDRVEKDDFAALYFWEGGLPETLSAVTEATGRDYQHVLNTGAPAYRTFVLDADLFYGGHIETGGQTPDGVAVGGFARVTLTGPDLGVAGHQDDSYQLWDAVEWRVSRGGADVTTYTLSAALDDDGEAPGETYPMGPHPIGDGPTPTSARRLRVSAGGAMWDTIRANGEVVGWKTGSFGAGDESTGHTIEHLAVESAMRQFGATDANGPAPETWEGSLLLRGGEAFAPEQALTLDQGASLPNGAALGVSSVFMLARPEQGFQVRLGPGTAREETRTVTTVTPSGEGFLVGLSAPTTYAHPAKERAFYAAPYWWDRYEWDVLRGAVALRATRLDYDAAFDVPPLVPAAGGPPVGRWAFFTESTTHTVRAIDIAAWEGDPATPPVTLATLAGGGPRGVAIEPATGDLYVACNGWAQIVRLPYVGSGGVTAADWGAAEEWLGGVSGVYGVAVADDGGVPTLLYTRADEQEARKRALDEGDPAELGASLGFSVSGTGESDYRHVAAYGASAYLCHDVGPLVGGDGPVRIAEAVALSGGAPSEVFEGGAGKRGITRNAAHLYLALEANTGSFILRRPADLSLPASTHASSTGNTCPLAPEQIAVEPDGSYLYIAGASTTTAGDLTGGLYRMPTSGSVVPDRLVTLARVRGVCIIDQ